MKNKNLDERELNFVNRLEKIGNFEYIGGYDTIKGNVKVLHKKCGCEVVMKAYTVAYSDIDKCRECGRQVREFEKCKEAIEAINPDITVIGREKDSYGKNRYYVMCNECSDVLFVSYDVLKEGNFKCCSDGVRAYIRASEYKCRELFNKLKNERKILNDEELMDFITEEIKDDTYLKVYKGLFDTYKLAKIIFEYIRNRQQKERIGICSCCGEYKTGTAGWGRGEVNYNSKVCLDCAKTPKKCACCGKEKKINSYPSVNGVYSDVCKSCTTKNK